MAIRHDDTPMDSNQPDYRLLDLSVTLRENARALLTLAHEIPPDATRSGILLVSASCTECAGKIERML